MIEKANKDDKETKIPREHKFAISDISHQHLAVFSYSKDEKTGTTKTKLEGNVVQRGECRPTGDLLYMGLKRQAFVKSQEPTRKVISLDRAVNNSFRPVSVHKVDAEFEKKKKAEGKKARDDKDKVVDVLMTAFQKHQYYALKDLAKITKQPIVSIVSLVDKITITPCFLQQQYLKEILNEHCIYNAKNPHKNTWELKPEYRHYEQPESSNN